MFLFVAVFGAAFTYNAFLPIRRSQWALLPSFVASLLTAELAGYHLLWQAAAAGLFVALGALEGWPGQVAFVLAVGSWLGLLVLVVQGQRSAAVIDACLAELFGERTHHEIQWWRVLVPFPLRLAKTRVVRNVEYARVAGRRLRLDVYLPVGREGPSPAVVQIHGGGWVVGDKREQGVPLMTRLSDRGFVGFNVNYRLSPGATWPDHLVDIKRAIAWIRAHADEYGVDPRFIAVTGGSAGGHLAAMAALTIGDRSYQPGFEDADTSVQAAVPFYGIYDLTGREGGDPPGFFRALLEPVVIKAFRDEEPEKFRDASPIEHIHPGAPPFLVIHGDRDSMAPLEGARRFVARLRAVSTAPVLYAEIPGAQHSFDVFVSPRSLPVIESVGHMLDHVYADVTRPPMHAPAPAPKPEDKSMAAEDQRSAHA